MRYTKCRVCDEKIEKLYFADNPVVGICEKCVTEILSTSKFNDDITIALLTPKCKSEFNEVHKTGNSKLQGLAIGVTKASMIRAKEYFIKERKEKAQRKKQEKVDKIATANRKRQEAIQKKIEDKAQRIKESGQLELF